VWNDPAGWWLVVDTVHLYSRAKWRYFPWPWPLRAPQSSGFGLAAGLCCVFMRSGADPDYRQRSRCENVAAGAAQAALVKRNRGAGARFVYFVALGVGSARRKGRRRRRAMIESLRPRCGAEGLESYRTFVRGVVDIGVVAVIDLRHP
jgi:hypothetical protein